MKTLARFFLLSLATAAFAVGPAAAQTAEITLDQLLGLPFSSSLTASPDCKSLAWITIQRGARNVWAARAPEYSPRNLTGWSQDDGQPLDGLIFTSDGQRVLFVRGDGPNRQGESPNPNHVPEGAEEAIWTVDFSGDPPRRLTEGNAPAPAPRGDGFAYLNRSQIWWMKWGADEKPVQLVHSRGSASNLRWSPDGSKLAFVSGRSENRLIGVYDTEARSVRYLDPSVDNDFSPIWSPDGTQVAFIRSPAADRLPFTPAREGQPWSVRIFDLAANQGRQAWIAGPGPGSAYWGLASPDDLFWTADGHLLFLWERDGWAHLYAVPVAGGPARLLTPGNFEVEQAALGPDGQTLYFTSNQEDIERRHIWSVTAAGGAPRRVTAEAGIQWSPTPLADQALAYLASDERIPSLPYLRIEQGVRPLGAAPAGFPADALAAPQAVAFPASDGRQVYGQLFLPSSAGDGQRHPAVLFFHGGSRRQMLLGWHYLDYYHQCYALNQYLASRGYVVLSVNYRSGIGYGMEFREAIGYGAAGASEFNDVTGAALYLAGRPEVDARRIGLWGGSYGGYLTALGLARASDLFAAGVDIHGVHDWNVVIANFRPSYSPLGNPEQARLAFESSPMASIDGWRSPALLIHGDDDRNVPFSETVDLVKALRQRGVEHEQLIFPDEVHDFLTHRSWKRAFEAAADFFERKLKGR